MSKSRFPLYLADAEHRAVRIAAAHRGETMTGFIRAAIAEKLARVSPTPSVAASEALNAKSAEYSASDALAEASEKPA